MITPLAGKGRVAMDQNRRILSPSGVTAPVLTARTEPFDPRVDDLQVRWVEGQRQVNRAARCGDIAGEALVVFDVTSRQVIGMLAFKFGKQVGGHLAQGVDQHVQSTAVGHAESRPLRRPLRRPSE